MRPHLVFGGTFDPLHRGHLVAAEAVWKGFGAPVSLLLAARPPHRPPPVASPADRLALLAAAAASRPWLRLDDRELDRPGPGFTVDNLAELRRELGERVPLVFILGRDAFREFHTWRNWPKILELAHLLVLSRPGPEAPLPVALQRELEVRRARSVSELVEEAAGRILEFPIPALPLSASAVRARLARGESAKELVTPEVLAEIERRGLYRADR